MAGQSSKGKKIGRDKVKCAAYKAHMTKEKHALKRVLKSSGVKAATAYAKAKGLKMIPVPVKRVGVHHRLKAAVAKAAEMFNQ